MPDVPYHYLITSCMPVAASFNKQSAISRHCNCARLAMEPCLTLAAACCAILPGAGVGLSTVLLAHLFPNATVLALEPDPQSFEILKHNTAQYPRVIPVNCGLWGTSTQLKLVAGQAGTATASYQQQQASSGTSSSGSSGTSGSTSNAGTSSSLLRGGGPVAHEASNQQSSTAGSSNIPSLKEPAGARRLVSSSMAEPQSFDKTAQGVVQNAAESTYQQQSGLRASQQGRDSAGQGRSQETTSACGITMPDLLRRYELQVRLAGT